MTQPRMPPVERWNIHSQVFLRDPYPYYARRREAAPVLQVAPGYWSVTGYEAVRDALRSKDLGRKNLQRAKGGLEGSLAEVPPGLEGAKMLNRWVLFRNPPDHSRLRSLMNRAFTPKLVEGWRERIRTITRELLQPCLEEGEFDFMDRFAYPLPVLVIASLIGVPGEDERRLRDWTRDMIEMIEPVPIKPEAEQRARRGVQELAGYLRDVIAQRRQHPGDDLLSELIRAEEAGDRLSEEELIANTGMLLWAGHETTANLIGNGLHALLREPGGWETFSRSPESIRPGLDELLRFDGPVQTTDRYTLRDTTIGGVPVPAGQTLYLSLGAANRDPSRFPEPDRLVLDRTDNPHLGFGAGIHYCIGAPLAIEETTIAYETLVELAPGIQLRDAESPRKVSAILRGFQELWVTV